jgi:hypothetical protein
MDRNSQMLRIESSGNSKEFVGLLDQAHVNYLTPKGDVAAVILALGGGAGLAVLVRSLAPVIKAYFDGKVELAKENKRMLTFEINGRRAKITVQNAEKAEEILLRELES